jgi:glutathione synthase/RimK-type ligase-like ATP-grasp enzyme
VHAAVTLIEPDEALAARARRLVERLRLPIAGVDFIVCADSAMLLEVNAYPGFDDIPIAQDRFIELAAKWWSRL